MREPCDQNLFALFLERMLGQPDTPAIETPDGKRLTYAALEAQSARYAGALAGLGARKGDRVLVQTQKSPETLALYLGCLRAGCVYLPLNTAYRQAEVEHVINDATPRLAVCAPANLEAAATLARGRDLRVLSLDADGTGSFIDAVDAAAASALVPCSGGDLAALLYTSGTTGRPKGVMLTHANLASNALVLHEAWGFVEGDVLLHALPLFHTHGLFVACHCALLNASPILFLERFDVETVVRSLPRTTVFMGVPTYYTRLLADPGFSREHCAAMRLFTSGSAPLLASTFAEFEERTGHRILERYGMTETGMNTSNPLRGERRAGTVGQALPGVELRVGAPRPSADVPADVVGELEVRGPNVFKGYWQLPEKTRSEFSDDGFFKTGDLATLDSDGYVSIVGRNKDLIITGGYNVYPKEVENEIDLLDGVRESAVIGVRDTDFGEAVTAVVVRSEDDTRLSETRVIEALKSVLANYKVPKTVHFVDTLPRNAMGKVQKNVLRERFG